MKTIAKECKQCCEVFQASLKEHKRGNAKFCNRKCSQDYRRGKKRKKVNNCECAKCSVSFYKSPARKMRSKSGLYFCSRLCKDEANCLEGGIKEIHPPHFGTGNGKHTYRVKAFKHLENKCAECGYDKYVEVLVVHHKDIDRNNNEIKNLEILCPTCHDEKHFLTISGRFHNSGASLRDSTERLASDRAEFDSL